jgi:hypothetical protein
MDAIELCVDSPEVDTISRTPQIVPTFEIINGEENRYPCDPTAAVDGAHLAFEAFTASRHIGHVTIHVQDEFNIAASIVNFLHGKPIQIRPVDAQTYLDFAAALGIPLIAKYAAQLCKAVQARQSSDGDEDLM